MEADPRLDPRTETSTEVQTAHDLIKDTSALHTYWNTLFQEHYLEVLESPSEIGRHGVIAELTQRLASNGHVLDVGCGTGILAELLDLNKFQYLGCDISDIAIGYAKSHRSRPNVEFRVSRLENLTHIPALSVVIFNEVLYYLNHQDALDLVGKWLVKNGLVITSIFDFPEGRELIDWLRCHLQLDTEIAIENTGKDLRWNILVGRIL